MTKKPYTPRKPGRFIKDPETKKTVREEVAKPAGKTTAPSGTGKTKSSPKANTEKGE